MMFYHLGFLGFSYWYNFRKFPNYGIMLLFIERLKISVRYSIARGPKCLRCFILMLSGPVELLFLLFRIASEICWLVRMICDVVGNWCTCVSIFLLILFEEYFVTFTNCLLKASVFSFSVIFSLLLIVITLFESCLFFCFEIY